MITLATGKLVNGTGTITLNKQSNELSLTTKEKFTDTDLNITLNVKTATPQFDGGTLSGSSTATGTNVTLSSTNNGIKVQTKYNASSTPVLYNGAVSGWVTAADNEQIIGSQSTGSTNGTAYYITDVTVPKDKSFAVTTIEDTALDTTSDLDITNNAYRRVDVTNRANAAALITNSGNTTVTSGSKNAGTVTVAAYDSSSASSTNSQNVVTNGVWNTNNVSAGGTYYGKTIVSNGSVTQNAPTVNSSGLVTATSTVSAGYVSADTKSNTLQLSTQAAKTVTPTESEQTAVASGKYTTGIVKVGAIPSSYIGSAIEQKDSSNVTVSGKTVTVPSGYYSDEVSKSVADGSVTLATPTINSSTGLVTSSATVTEGYVDAATPSKTLQLTTKASTTYNVNTSEQTIAAGTYLTGKQTIRAVATSGIEAANIKDGATITVGDTGSATRIKNVTGTFTDASTVSSGQTAATAAQIRSGYSAWVDGGEVKGSLGNTSVTQGTTTVSSTTANRGTASWGNGVIASGSIDAATFNNSATSGKTYVDISNTTDAPVLVSGDYLYINKGYTDDLKISLAKLVPDGASANLASNKILSGYSAYNNDGTLIAGNIASQAAQTLYPKTTDQTVASGKYLSGTQTFKAVTTSGISAANIKHGSTIKVGDAADDDRITAVTGTFTKASTVSSGQTAATASQIMSGYSAWVDGTEVKGNIASKDSSNLSVDGKTVTAPAGYYATDASADVALGTVTSGTASITSLSHTYNSTSGKFDVSGSANVSAPTVGTAGYISSSEGTKNAKNGGATVNAAINKIVATNTISTTTGTGSTTATKKPSITKQSTPSGVTNAASGDATTTAPTSGVYVAVKSAANTGKLVATPAVTTAGYGDATNHGIATATATYGAAASDTTYVPITTTSASVNGKTVSYGSGWITEGSKSVAVGTVTSGSATISSASYAYNSTNNNFDVTGSATVAAPSVGTAGYISTTEGTRNSNTASLSTTVAKIVGSTTITGTTTKKPSITKQSTPTGVTNAASGNATTTAPSSGVYVAVKSDANTGTLTATPSVTTAGYGTASNNGITGNTATVGAAASDTTYIPITTTSATVSGKTVSYGSGWIASGSKSVADGSVVQNAPTINTSTGLVTATSTVTEGYVEAGTKSNTLQLTAQGAQTITPSTTDQTIASGKYLTGAQTIKGDADLTAANIKKGVEIFGVTGTFTTTPSGKTALTASALRSGYAGFINGSQVNGSMADTSVTEGTTTVSSDTATRGTWSQTAGYTAARTINAATFANSATSGKTYVDISSTTDAPVLVAGDYLYIDKGYVDDIKISLAKLVPDGSDVKDHGDYILSGHSAYDNDGTLVAGSIPTRSSSNVSVSGKTVTTTAGYYASNVSKSVAVGTITSGSATISSLTKTYNSTSGKFDVTGSANVSAPSVGTAGYVSSSEGTKNANNGGATVSATLDKIVGSTSITGTTTKTPSITKQDVPSGVTQAASGSATTTAPSSGVYVAVKSAATTGTLTATPSVTTAGYGTADYHGIAANTATVGANASAMTYIPITTTSASVSGKTVSYGSGWITAGSKSVADGAYSASVSSHSITTTPVVTTALSGTVTSIGTTTKPSGTDGTDYWTITPSGSVSTTGVSSAKGKATIGTAGYIATGNKETTASTVNITPTVSAGTTRYIAKASSSTSNGTATATAGTASTTVSGMVTTSTDTGYSVSASATGGNASVTASSVTVGAGYNPSSVTASTTAKSATGTSASETKYIQKGVLSASVSSNTGGSASMAATGFTAASSATDYYVTLSTIAGSVKAKAQVGTEGYVKTETDETSATSVAVSGNGNKLYIPAGTITNNTSGGSSTATINRGNQIKIGKGYYPNDLYYKAQNNSGTLTIDTSKNRGSISVDGYSFINITGINIPKPSSGTNTFAVKVPNGSSTITFTFSVDSSGNVTIT